MKADVDFCILDINELDESFGKFDIVLCSNVFPHLKDIYTCIEKIKDVTKEKAILATQLSNHLKLMIPILWSFLGQNFIWKRLIELMELGGCRV